MPPECVKPRIARATFTGHPESRVGANMSDKRPLSSQDAIAFAPPTSPPCSLLSTRGNPDMVLDVFLDIILESLLSSRRMLTLERIRNERLLAGSPLAFVFPPRERRALFDVRKGSAYGVCTITSSGLVLRAR
jgi:hypothetical protein